MQSDIILMNILTMQKYINPINRMYFMYYTNTLF